MELEGCIITAQKLCSDLSHIEFGGMHPHFVLVIVRGLDHGCGDTSGWFGAKAESVMSLWWFCGHPMLAATVYEGLLMLYTHEVSFTGLAWSSNVCHNRYLLLCLLLSYRW